MRSGILYEEFDRRRIQCLHRKAKGEPPGGVHLIFSHPQGMASMLGVGLESAVVELRSASSSGHGVVIKEYRKDKWASFWRDPSQGFSLLIVASSEQKMMSSSNSSSSSSPGGLEKKSGSCGHPAQSGSWRDLVIFLIKQHWGHGTLGLSLQQQQFQSTKDGVLQDRREWVSQEISEDSGIWALAKGIKLVFQSVPGSECTYHTAGVPESTSKPGAPKNRSISKPWGTRLRRQLKSLLKHGRGGCASHTRSGHEDSADQTRPEPLNPSHKHLRQLDQCAIQPGFHATFSSDGRLRVQVEGSFQLKQSKVALAHDNLLLSVHCVDPNAAELEIAGAGAAEDGSAHGQTEGGAGFRQELRAGPALFAPETMDEKTRGIVAEEMRRQLIPGVAVDEEAPANGATDEGSCAGMPSLLIADESSGNKLAFRAKYEPPVEKVHRKDRLKDTALSMTFAGDYVAVYPGCRQYVLGMERQVHVRDKSIKRARDRNLLQLLSKRIWLNHSFALAPVDDWVCWASATHTPEECANSRRAPNDAQAFREGD